MSGGLTQWGCISCGQEPVGTPPGEPTLNAFPKETLPLADVGVQKSTFRVYTVI